jgi:hypothetical protein
MICPNCKAEYRTGFTHCSDCGLKLQPLSVQAALDEAPPAQSQAEPSAVLWRGQDPVAFSVVLSALDEQGIFYVELQRRDYAAALSQPVALGFYGLPHWEVRVGVSDLVVARIAAQKALEPVSILAVEANSECDQAQPDRSAAETSVVESQPLTPVKIWSGDAPALAQELRDSLVSTGIRCWKLSSSSPGETLLVDIEDQDRAQAILRDTLERMAAA